MKKLIGIIASLALLFSIAKPVLAAEITNGSFEFGLGGWTIESGDVDYGLGGYWTAAEGDQSIDLNGSEAGAISQTLITQIGQVYRVSFFMSGNPDGLPALKQLTVSINGFQPAVFMYDTAQKENSREEMKWEQKNYLFMATETSTKLVFTSNTEGPYGPALDNIAISDATKNDCKDDTWQNLGIYKSQGDCVSYYATNFRNLPSLTAN